MKLILKITLLFALISMVSPAWAGDRTRYDCRETVAVRTVRDGVKGRAVKFIKVCPHKDQLAAGQCETDFWGRMRCKG